MKNDFEEFETLYGQIVKEFQKQSDYKNKILGNLLMVILFKMKERFWSTYNPREEGNRSSRIVKSFKHLLELEFKKVIGKEQINGKLQAQHFAKKNEFASQLSELSDKK